MLLKQLFLSFGMTSRKWLVLVSCVPVRWLKWRLRAVHAVRASFLRDDTEAILLVDASNAFNSLNRIVALHNIHQLSPSFVPILINTYRSAATLYIAGDTLLSEEATTQGIPLPCMP